MFAKTAACKMLVKLTTTDGNLVLYDYFRSDVMWSTLTNGTESVVARMQDDGNFVLYTANNDPTWATGTFASNGKNIFSSLTRFFCLSSVQRSHTRL